MEPLTLEMYLMGRDKAYPDEWNFDLECNARSLIRRVNNLLHAISVDRVEVSSGWRPDAINMAASGAKRSLHKMCKAVDLVDKNSMLKNTVMRHTDLLLDFGLWMEHPESSPTWIHLDVGIRSARAVQIFRP